jgi:hypothetical protein
MVNVEAIIANKLAPGALDHYLARNGFRSQQTSEPKRNDNLWEPVRGDHGAHGPFDSVAREGSWELRANLDRLWIGAGLATVALLEFSFFPSSLCDAYFCASEMPITEYQDLFTKTAHLAQPEVSCVRSTLKHTPKFPAEH